jgi:hypothetical protein
MVVVPQRLLNQVDPIDRSEAGADEATQFATGCELAMKYEDLV